MAKAKAEALELIKLLPDDVTTGVIMEELFFRSQVKKGLEDLAQGRTLTHQELKERIARWRKVRQPYSYLASLRKEMPVMSRSLPARNSRSTASLILRAVSPGTLLAPQRPQSIALTFSTSA